MHRRGLDSSGANRSLTRMPTTRTIGQAASTRAATATLLLVGLCIPALDEATAHANTTDYELEVRKLYDDPDAMLANWPVEFHIRIVEGITQDLARSLVTGAPPGDGLWHDTVSAAWGQPGPAVDRALDLSSGPWRVEKLSSAPPAEMTARLKSYRDSFESVEYVSFKPKKGRVPAPGRFTAEVAFELLGTDRSGRVRDHGRAAMAFVKTAAGWRIDGLALLRVERTTRPKRFYHSAADSMFSALPETVRGRLLYRSASDEAFHRLGSKSGRVPGAIISPVAMDAHPGVAVVDIDGDGYDDLYTWDVLGPADLLLNRKGADGGRVFREAADEFGLRAENISAAVFGDLNNDGTVDVVLGRWYGPSEIRLGVDSGGHLQFVPHALNHTRALPSQVTTVTLADVNRDGTLDIFFATASQEEHQRRLREGNLPRGADLSVSQVGPPNQLWVSHEGSWRDQTDTWGLGLERNSLSAAFADYDQDGDLDLYVGNDFAPATMYRHDGERYTDISTESGADRIYYGMGASWGDIDNDGDLDLFATAMSSSAGTRILAEEGHFGAHLGKSDRQARRDARRGNTLLLNSGGLFSDGTREPRFNSLRNGNWAYGAVFVDIDRDGKLDVYAPNGFFTSPWTQAGAAIRDL